MENRCGSCEFQGACGGCRARAYGMSGDFMAEDPLCSYQPGKYRPEEIELRFSRSVQYGHSIQEHIHWNENARERINKVPRFVRGMVVKAVESYCEKNGIVEVTAVDLEKIRSEMPMRRMFGNSN